MPYRIHGFRNGRAYHVVNKGRDGRRIFNSEADYEKFAKMVSVYSVGRVRVEAFALVWNHFHFLLRQREHGGVQEFMKVLQMQYSRSFEKGSGLFKGCFWAEEIQNSTHYYRVLDYILRNPVKHKLGMLGLDGVSGSTALKDNGIDV
ncbi:hypothetical protein HOG17_02755 [Candidatus Peregrinibacteria bacterium]|jgi:REP element-mobilizing transposase RayT|nr:hypothetical protein [Candidatus Peregrinibacteria bacterium]MBT4148050.1 hypothetical protein [Candidatus Peregrinibacteria bacterium]MBT4366046.1 hypothetical protein [Candidatus Peregrinibacteria bacterium]MBT4456128.1 hypothetical protein [Candidatus Peregrinibacteria bacterium]